MKYAMILAVVWAGMALAEVPATKPASDYPALRRELDRLQDENRALKVELGAARKMIVDLHSQLDKLRAATAKNDAPKPSASASEIKVGMTVDEATTILKATAFEVGQTGDGLSIYRWPQHTPIYRGLTPVGGEEHWVYAYVKDGKIVQWERR